jgi:ABC-type branched-subunit amino acid transport system ATPase component
MTVLDNMIMAVERGDEGIANVFPWTKSARRNKAQAIGQLAEVGLAEKADDNASSLSGGQMRLLEISRTLALGATVLLLDEPTAGVSPRMKKEVSAMLEKLKARGLTVLVIEHDINFIQALCERILVLDEGKVVLDGPPHQVRQDPRLQAIYFGGDEGASTASK